MKQSFANYIKFFSILLLAISCSSSPILYPNLKFKEAGKENADKEIKKCRELSETHLKSSKNSQVAKSAGMGAAMGAAGGFVSGLIFGGGISGAVESGAKSAVVGGAVGGAAGALSPDQIKQRFVNQCLTEKGYKVIGWD